MMMIQVMKWMMNIHNRNVNIRMIMKPVTVMRFFLS